MSAQTQSATHAPRPLHSDGRRRSASTPSSCVALCALFCTLLQKSESHPLCAQSFARSLQKHWGCPQQRFFLATRSPRASKGHSPLSPLESALTGKRRVLPGFGRNRRPTTPLESALTRKRSVTPLESALTKKPGGRGALC